MIIDMHVHIGDFGHFHMSPETVLESMEKYGVSHSVISSGVCSEFDDERNEVPHTDANSQCGGLMQTIEFARANPGKVTVLPWCKPHTEGFNEELVHTIEKNKDIVKGLKFHPYSSMLPLTDKRIEPYLAFAEENGFPVMVHSAEDEWSKPIFVYEVAKKYPKINFIMAHIGLCDNNDEGIELIGSLPNLYGDTAWVRPEYGLKLVKKYGAHKLLFGSDNPIDGVDTYANPFYQEYFGEFKNHVSSDDYELIMHGNSERIFNISL